MLDHKQLDKMEQREIDAMNKNTISLPFLPSKVMLELIALARVGLWWENEGSTSFGAEFGQMKKTPKKKKSTKKK